MILKTNFRIVF